VNAGERLLRPDEVEKRFGVSRRWVYQAAQDRRLPCVRLGGPDGPLRFRQDVIERLLAEWSTGARS
jgi:predicted DNA-binding transcriptional regulator AlpA